MLCGCVIERRDRKSFLNAPNVSWRMARHAPSLSAPPVDSIALHYQKARGDQWQNQHYANTRWLDSRHHQQAAIVSTCAEGNRRLMGWRGERCVEFLACNGFDRRRRPPKASEFGKKKVERAESQLLSEGSSWCGAREEEEEPSHLLYT